MAEHIFEQLAREHGITVEEKRAQWRKIPCAGELPTPDEWLRYAVERIRDDGRDELIRKYLNW